jgi:NRPS condensation-like uncharacterized protein
VTAVKSARSRAGLASWPLTPIEELDLYLESAADPSLIQLELVAGSHLDVTALAAALASVLAADPAARRHLAATSRWRRRLRWEAGAPGHDDGVLTVASWRSPGQLAALREWVSTWPIPLCDRTVRLVLAAGPEHDVVILQTHHAAFDGISSLALLTAIGTACRERGGDLTSPGPQAVWPIPARPFGTVGPAGTRGAGWIPRALTRIPARIPARLPGAATRIAAHSGRPDRPGYGYVQRSLPVPRPAREGSGPFPTVNDLLLAALIRTVDRWNTAHGRRSGRIRVSVPVSDRGHQNHRADPGNQTRLIRVTARGRERADPGRLLAHVAAQTRAAKQRTTAGLDATSRLLATGWAPAAVKCPAVRLAGRLAAPLCTDTALLSNLGAIACPPCFSGSGTEPLWFSGPARMPRGLGIGAVTIAGKLHLCVHYRHALLDRDAAADFTALYCEALGELTGSPA